MTSVSTSTAVNKNNMCTKQEEINFFLTEIALDTMGNKIFDIYGKSTSSLFSLILSESSKDRINDDINSDLSLYLNISDKMKKKLYQTSTATQISYPTPSSTIMSTTTTTLPNHMFFNNTNDVIQIDDDEDNNLIRNNSTKTNKNLEKSNILDEHQKKDDEESLLLPIPKPNTARKAVGNRRRESIKPINIKALKAKYELNHTKSLASKCNLSTPLIKQNFESGKVFFGYCFLFLSKIYY